MVNDSHQESDLLPQCREVVVFEELGNTFALVDQLMLVLHFSQKRGKLNRLNFFVYFQVDIHFKG